MKLITRNSDYALRALCYLAENHDRIVPVPELIECLKIPRPFLRGILQEMNRGGLLHSHKGKGGGFTLRFRPEMISVLRVVEIFQGPLQLTECFLKKRPCPHIDVCKLRRRLEKIQEKTKKELGSITLNTLLKTEKGSNGSK